MSTKFSVAIPAYNCAPYLEETLRSILDQELPPDEIIIVDDGSTDTTPDVIAKFGEKVKSTRIANSGPGAARKYAIDQCKNSWIALCDSDDIWCKNHLANKHRAIELFPETNIVCSNFVSFGPTAVSGQTRLGVAPEGWLERYTGVQREKFRLLHEPYGAMLDFNSMYLSGLAISSELYQLAGGINLAYRDWQAEDSEFTRRMVAQESARLVMDTDITWHYRRHANNFSAKHWKNLYAKARIIQEHIDTNIVPEHNLDHARRLILDARGEAFDSAFWEYHYHDARKIYSELPKSHRTVKRKMRRLLSSVRRS
ncbi:MAG: glycosyltransferase family A protein [Pseudomonadales bacterium]|nr:glycosyltransferase family A protein [Pseudomonadales bacterium]